MKAQTILSLFVLLGIHVFFIFPIFLNETHLSPFYFWIGVSFLIVICLGYAFEMKKKSSRKSTNLWIPVYVIVGAVVTFWIHHQLEFGSVIAAGSVGLAASYIPDVIRNSSSKDIPPAIYCGAFVGMSSSLLFADYLFLIAASGISGFLLMLTKDVLNGFGGKLGTIAFGGVISVTLMLYLW